MRFALSVLALLAATTLPMALGNAPPLDDNPFVSNAQDFCAKAGAPDASTCRFVRDDDEAEQKVITSECYESGTVNGGWPNDPPNAILSPFSPGLFQFFNKYLSLNCRGQQINVSAVFKVVNVTDVGDLYPGTGLDAETNTTRCTLGAGEVPQEAPGKNCTSCYKNECPLEVGVWYEDILNDAMADSCPPDVDGPIRYSLYVNPGQTLNVSSFEAAAVA